MTNFTAQPPQLVTPGTAGNQVPATIVPLQGGGWVVAAVDGQTQNAQMFDATGAKVGTPVEMPGLPQVFGAQYNQSIQLLPLAGGGYAFMWLDSSNALWGETVDASGHALAPVQIAASAQSPTSSDQVKGAALAGGGYVVGIMHGGSTDYTIVTQRVDASNHLLGGPATIVSQTLAANQSASMDFMFGTPDGGYLAGPAIQTTHPVSGDPNPHATFGVTLYKVDASGQPTGATLSADGETSAAFGVAYPNQVELTNGDMVTSTVFDKGGGVPAIQLNVSTNPGQPVGTVTIANGDAASGDTLPRVVALANGNFLVALNHVQDTSAGANDPLTSGTYVHTFDGAGHSLGATVAVSSSASFLALSDGGFLAFDVGAGAHAAQYHDVSGQAAGDPVALPGVGGALIPTADGGFVLDYMVSGDGWDAYVEKFSTAAAPPGSGPIQGTSGDDHLAGTSGNDRIDGISGNDTLDGGAGTDTAVIETSLGGVQSYAIGGGGVTLTTALGTDTLMNIERVQFSDALFALDTSPGGHVWEAAALFHAGFGALPGMADLSHWTAQADQSGSMGDLAQRMIDSYAPGISSQALVGYLYQQLTHQAATADVVQSYVDQIGPGKTFATQGDLLAYAANLSLNTDGIASIVGTVQQLDPQAF